MWKVKYIEKGAEHDFKRVDHEVYIIARSYFKAGSLYYFRINEFNYAIVADEDILHIVEF